VNRIKLTIAAFVAAATVLVVTGTCHDGYAPKDPALRSTAPEPQRVAAVRPATPEFGPIVGWVDVADCTTARALPSLRRVIDSSLGYPRANDVDASGATLHHAEARAHSSPCRWAYPLDARSRAIYLAARARCAAEVDGGSPRPVCTRIVALPLPVAALDATWTPNVIVNRAWDAGANGQPDDDFPDDLP
jgi:hypothetical protein